MRTGCGFRRSVHEVIPLSTQKRSREGVERSKAQLQEFDAQQGAAWESRHRGWRCTLVARSTPEPRSASSCISTSAITCVTNPSKSYSIEVEDDNQEEHVRHETLVTTLGALYGTTIWSASTMQTQFKLWSALSEQFTTERRYLGCRLWYHVEFYTIKLTL